MVRHFMFRKIIFNSCLLETPVRPPERILHCLQLYLRWLLDSEVFNEWMNPNDYETEEFLKEQEQLKARGITGVVLGTRHGTCVTWADWTGGGTSGVCHWVPSHVI